MVHRGRRAARADGADRRCPAGGDRDPQLADGQPPRAPDVVLPAGRPPPPDPRRCAALPIRSARADEPPRLARAGPDRGPRGRRATDRRGHPQAGRPGGRDTRPRAGPGADRPRRRQLRDRTGPRHRAVHGGRACRRGDGPVGPGPRGRQRRAGAPRLGRRCRRLVHLQVPQRRAGLDRRDLRPRAVPRGRHAPATGRLVGRATPSVGSRWTSASCRPAAPPAGRPRPRPCWRWRRWPPHWRIFDEVGMPALRSRSIALDRLPCRAARRRGRRGHHPARSGRQGRPAVAAVRVRDARRGRARRPRRPRGRVRLPGARSHPPRADAALHVVPRRLGVPPNGCARRWAKQAGRAGARAGPAAANPGRTCGRCPRTGPAWPGRP